MPAGHLSSRHQKTLDRIYETPTLANVRWSEVVSLLVALGCEVVPTRGSMYLVSHRGGSRLVLHRPHPGSECRRNLVERIREYLEMLDG